MDVGIVLYRRIIIFSKLALEEVNYFSMTQDFSEIQSRFTILGSSIRVPVLSGCMSSQTEQGLCSKE